jgi:predicted metalloprotease with PDZ domain
VIHQRSRLPLLHLVTLLLLLLSVARTASGAIRYDVSLARPAQHLLRVSMQVPDVHGDLRLQMAAWNALYEIRDFSSHVQQVEATADGHKVDIEKVDKLTWHLKASGTVTVQYSTFWDDSGPFSAQLNADHAFINPALILLYVPERRAEKTLLTLSDVPRDWRVASAALVHAGAPDQSYQLEAATYDALIDAPIEASKFEEFTLHDLSPPVHVVIHGDGWKKHDVESALRKICSYELRLMEGAPYDQYTFLFHIGKAAGGGGGGMEHANSTAIFVPSGEFLPNVSAHEFFHLWNVKRIRPASLEPVDYTREMYTRSLWFAEGVTNTYGSYALVRTGLWNKQEFYQDLSSQISEIEVRPAERWQSVEQSSLDAWLEKYALYNQPERSVSYYTKGQVLGFLLDILIRDRTDNQHSLDDVMRSLNSDFAREGKFYQDSFDVRRETEKITGASLDSFFSRYVSGAEPLPYGELLPRVGLELHTREISRASLGFVPQREPNGPWVVATVDSDSDAARSGLHVGDEILRWDNSDPPRKPEHWVAQKKPGELLHLRVRREFKEENIDLRLTEVHDKFFQVVETSKPDERARRIRDAILHGTTDPVTARNR